MSNDNRWSSGVPPDIFYTITSKLAFIDTINMSMVCRNWNSACDPCTIRTPWLMKPVHATHGSMSYAETRTSLSTVRNDMRCEADYPTLLNRRICGSFPGGWVMTVDQGSDIRLMNLVDNTSVQLPPLTAFPGVIKKLPTPHGSEHPYIYTFLSYGFPPEVDLPSDMMRDTYISKVAISSSPNSDGCVVMVIHGQERLLSYFRIGSDMKAWRLANPGGRLYCYHDLIYHKGEICEEGNFLAVRVQNNSVSVAVILGLEENNPGVQVKRFQGFKVKSVHFHMYVLELSGQPLVACRLVDALTNGRTVGFQLYLVSVAGFRELVSLEDSSIFIGQNSSFSLSCIDYPRCRRNQIYFTKSFLQTDRRNRPVGFRCSDVGVCDFARNIIHQDERVSLFDGPPPIWITPFNYPSSSTLRFGPRAAAGNQKVNVKLVVIGHTSCGKSTIVGNLLHQLHDDVDNLLIGINRNNVAKFSFAWILDKLKAERERGFSIDNASWKFDTRRYSCTLTVCPGRRDFIRNMITGASEADCVILIVDSGKGFEIGMSEDGQTREHVLLAYALGVKQIICCCNKMDATLGSYSSIRYYEIVKVMSTYLEEIGYSPIKIHFVPVSGLYGKNLVKWSSKMDWYNGPTLLEAINRIQEPKHLSEMPLCLPPRQMYYIGAYQASVGSLGCEYSGGFHTNTFAAFAPGESADVAMLLQNYKRDGGASTSKHEPAKEAVTFIAEIVLLKYPGRILNGFTAVVDNQSYHNTMRVEEVLVKIDEKTGKELPVMFLENKDVGIVKLCIMNMAVAESLFKYPPLGRFLLRDIKGTVAVGVIKSIDKM